VAGAGVAGVVVAAGGVAGGDCAQVAAFSVSAAAGISATVAKRDRRERVIRRVSSDILQRSGRQYARYGIMVTRSRGFRPLSKLRRAIQNSRHRIAALANPPGLAI
jgi:hypothetical protein